MAIPAKIRYLLYKVRSSFWFLPTVVTAAAGVLSQVSLHIDDLAPTGWLGELGWLYRVGPEGARLFLSTLAGSMITVTSLVFSLTLVALTMASSQFGPRLLTIFMRDRVNQVVLGTFLATFVFSLLVLRTVYETDDGRFIPYISVTIALVLAITSFGLLIYFVHHVSDSIQADTVIANVKSDLNRAIDRHFKEIEETGEEPRASQREADPADAGRSAAAIKADVTGYLQTIDHDRLMTVAVECDGLIVARRRAGQFVAEGEEIAEVRPAEVMSREAGKTIVDAFVIGPKRTMAQDIEFALNALVEIAMRALSPGINDAHTAIACVDHISGALVRATKRGLPVSTLCDSDGHVRLQLNAVTYEGLLDTAFDEIRQCAVGNVAVTIRLIEALSRVALFAHREEHRKAIAKQAKIIARGCKTAVTEPADLADIQERLRDLNRLIEPGSDSTNRGASGAARGTG